MLRGQRRTATASNRSSIAALACVEIIGMGNCISATGSDDAQGRGSSSSRGKRDVSLREADLHLVPGRIFSNDGSSNASIYTQQGRKGINQDAMILWEDLGGGGGILCGVFDGHGPHGHLVARKVRDSLPLKLLSVLPAARESLGCCFSAAVTTPSPSSWRRAFMRSYKAMDRELRSHPNLDCFCSGSTAVTVLNLGSDLFMANIGDSRAILGSVDEAGSSMAAVQLTVDLKPDLPREAERIKQCQGRVFALQDEPEVPRVWLPFDDAPGLAMARAFGDFCLKDYGVISVPEFSHWTLTDRDRFLVLASDGVWDVLSNKEVVDIVSSSPTRSSAAKFLVDAATREWKLKYPTSKMDDCTVVCLYLDGKLDTEFTHGENDTRVSGDYTVECNTSEASDAQNLEPMLGRNFTVRSMGSTRLLIVEEEDKDHGETVDQNWLGLEGVTRVNSLVQLPRFSDGKGTA